MKVVYIAGPFRADSSWKIEENIRRAEALALDAWKMGYAVICPHANTRFYQGECDDRVWLDGDLEILSRCDAVLLALGWKNSTGACEEVKHANRNGIPVYERLIDLIGGDRPLVMATGTQ
ncbi:hypothetical protein LCGC14_1674630 [marine sediment metagenome]|uniref:DUF7768 domain-containing protein n=1 Tax=marine sediment metagenome TaxID=412755 RepID=A0A0F9HR68_9ZZZZ